jgi:hypothetical protein
MSCEKMAEEEIKAELEALAISLRGPTDIIEVGAKVSLSASVAGGLPPYTYTWSGASGYGATASVTPASVGDLSVSCKATDAQGYSGEASFLVRVGPSKVKMQGLKGDVFYGETTILNAWGMGLKVQETKTKNTENSASGDGCPEGPFCVDYKNSGTIAPKAKEVQDDWFYPENNLSASTGYIVDPSREFLEGNEPKDMVEDEDRVIWQAEPGVTFDPPMSTDGTTKITYDRVGEVKVWCEMHKFIEGAYQTVGECEQETVMVKPPSFSISFAPENGAAYIGQTVIATIHAKPGVPADIIDYRWLDPPTSNRLQLDKNAQRIQFTVIDMNPVKLNVLARVPVHGDELAEFGSSYTGSSYSINAWMVQPPNLARVWDPKKGGFRTLERSQRLTGERITLKAEVEGANQPEGIRWDWIVNEGTTISNTLSQTPTVTRSEAGSIVAKVRAKDKDNRNLGNAEVTVSVVEPPLVPVGAKDDNPSNLTKKELVDKNIEKKRKQDEFKKKLAQAKDLSKKGKFDEAIAKAEEAVKEDPQNAEAQEQIKDTKKEKQRIDKGLEEVTDLIKKSEFKKAQDALIPLLNKAGYYPPAQKMDRELGEKWQAHSAKVNAALADVNVKSKNKDYKEALESIAVARKTLKLLPSELETLAQEEWYCQDLEGKKEKARQFFRTAKEKLTANDFEGSIKDYKDGFALASDLWNLNIDKTPANAAEAYQQALAMKKEFEAEALKASKTAEASQASKEKNLEPVLQKQASPQAAYQTDKVVSGNADEIITLSDVGIHSATKIRISVKIASDLAAKGRKDSARIGEVEFYHKGKKLIPSDVTAESVYSGFSAEQAMDGDRKYSYLANGAKGWASEAKSAGSLTWLEFAFNPAVAVDKVIITTAPTTPYRLYSFDLQSNSVGNNKATGTSEAKYLPIAGKYAINANGYKGGLIFSGRGDKIEGVLNLGKLEILTDISVANKKVTFTRVIGSIIQVYTGDISGVSDKVHLEGTFTSQGRVYKWVADMTEIPKNKSNLDESLIKIVGKWSVNTNGYKGTLILKSTSGKIQGILHLNIGDEQIDDVSFDGKILKFTRPLPKMKLTQAYTGTVSAKGMIRHVVGTFSTNGNGAAPWSGDLVEP